MLPVLWVNSSVGFNSQKERNEQRNNFTKNISHFFSFYFRMKNVLKLDTESYAHEINEFSYNWRFLSVSLFCRVSVSDSVTYKNLNSLVDPVLATREWTKDYLKKMFSFIMSNSTSPTMLSSEMESISDVIFDGLWAMTIIGNISIIP